MLQCRYDSDTNSEISDADNDFPQYDVLLVVLAVSVAIQATLNF